MIITTKTCDGCDATKQLEPILIGNLGTGWIEVRGNSFGAGIFTRTYHFHNEECLFSFMKRKM